MSANHLSSVSQATASACGPLKSRFARACVPVVVLITLPLSGCAFMSHEQRPVVAIADMKPTSAAAAAGLNPSGQISFTATGADRVLVTATIKGLKPNAEHGLHVHAVSDCSGDGVKSGGHFNPDAHTHNHPGQTLRHAGAMFNLKTDANGVGTTRQEVDTITLTAGRNSIIGMPVIIHRDPDDYVSQPLGNAGPRVSCGVIRIETTTASK
jgi:superoxide dismutase, Cu-Zn family